MIVINYRRSDAAGYALYIQEKLTKAFGNNRVFLDVGGELSGAGEFAKVIFDKIEHCRLLICLIGPQWLNTMDGFGPRLHNPDDLVRREIDLAFQRNKAVLPVLLNGARMPDRNSLPACIADLVKNDAVFFRHERYVADTDELIKATRRALAIKPASACRSETSMYSRDLVELPRLPAAPTDMQTHIDYSLKSSFAARQETNYLSGGLLGPRASSQSTPWPSFQDIDSTKNRG